MMLYFILFLTLNGIAADITSMKEWGQPSQVIMPQLYKYDKDKALHDLRNLTPLNFCNNWNRNLQEYLEYVSKLSSVVDENRRIKNTINKLMNSVQNTIYAHLKSTKNHLDNPYLQLLPYIMGLSMLPPTGAAYYGYFHLPELLYFYSAIGLMGYFSYQTISDLQSEFDLLNFRLNQIQKYANKLR